MPDKQNKKLDTEKKIIAHDGLNEGTKKFSAISDCEVEDDLEFLTKLSQEKNKKEK